MSSGQNVHTGASGGHPLEKLMGIDAAIENSYCSREVAMEAKPLFVALGFYHKHFYFHRTSDDRTLHFTARAISRKGTILTLHPDINHWRSISSSRMNRWRRVVDWDAIGSMLIELCIKAGPYRPSPEDMPPRNPRGADKVPRIRRTRAQIEADRAAEDAAYEAAKNIK